MILKESFCDFLPTYVELMLELKKQNSFFAVLELINTNY